MYSKSLIISVVHILLMLRYCRCEVTIDPTTCGTRGLEPMVSSAFAEMAVMADIAYYRTVRTLNNALPPGNIRVVESTFRSYFGPILVPDFISRYNTLVRALDVVRNLSVYQPPNIIIFCDDSIVIQSNTDEHGAPVPLGVTQYVGWQDGVPYYFPQGTLMCRDRPRGGGTILAVATPQRGWIMLCPFAFQILPATVQGVHQDQSGQPGFTIQNMKSISNTLLHEFLHILYGGGMYGAVGVPEMQGFQQCFVNTLLNYRSNVFMPDCIALYALSLYCALNDWSSGTPRTNPTR